MSSSDLNKEADSADGVSGRLVARPKRGDNAEPFTITEISNQLKRTVEDRFGYVRLRGELSGVKRAASGHLYCSLKDDKAVLDGVMWRGSAARLPFKPEDGLEIIASGKITTYGARSKYQIVIESMEIAGEGALLALLEKTRARLAEEGLFAAERKRRLPFLPRVIGVVTSPTGAVIRDIMHRLDDRFPSHVLVWPVLVQGTDAARQVAEAVRGFGALAPGGAIPRPDLLIIARGGGSIEDLWGFNEEIVVRAIAESPIPTISAIGHETDTTLADLAADRRAPTPSAAAEMAVPVRMELTASLAHDEARLKRAVLRPVNLGRERLTARSQRLAKPQNMLQPYAQRLDEVSARLASGLKDKAAKAENRLLRVWTLSPAGLAQRQRRAQQKLVSISARLSPRLLARISARKAERLAGLARLVESLNPDRILERGYVRVSGPDGETLTRAAEAINAPHLTLHFRDGLVQAAPQSEGAAPPAPPAPIRPARKSRPSAPDKRQDDLFGGD